MRDEPSSRRTGSPFRHVTPYVARHWVSLALQAVCYAAAAAVTAALASCIQQITDAAVKADWNAVWAMALPVCGLLAAGALAAFGSSASAGYFSSSVSRELRIDTIRRMLDYPYHYYESHHSGDLVSRLNNDISFVQSFFRDTFTSLIRQPLMFIVITLALARVDLVLLLPTLLITPITTIVNFRYGKKLLRHYRAQQEGYASLTKAVQDTVQGIGIVKSYRLYDRMIERIQEGNRKITTNILGVISIATNRSWIVGINKSVPTILTVVLGGLRAISGQMSPGDLFAFFFLYHFLNGIISDIPDITVEVQGITGVLERANELWELPLERSDGGGFEPDAGQPLLELKDVHFSYSSEAPVLQGVDLCVPKGQKIAIVGKSGCGKSTLLKLVCAFGEPAHGTLIMHGHPYGEWNIQELRRRISIVSQDTFLFPATIAENIAYGGAEADRDRIQWAARMAGADDFINEMPDKYETLTGERGIRLSGGQRQRISIARALLKDAPMLLLDEPTSSLDAESEAVVQQAIERLMEGRTVLIAAHRLSTIRNVDFIAVMEDGLITERGTHRQLIDSDGVYRRLYQRQMETAEA